MSRKRGKKHKPAVEAIPQDILAEGSGPVGVDGDAITTADDVATSDDVATIDDVVDTADDVVAAPGDGEGDGAPAHATVGEAPVPAEQEKPRGKRRGKKAAAAEAPEAEPVLAAEPDEPARFVETGELNNAELAELVNGEAAAAEAVGEGVAAAGDGEAGGELGDRDGDLGDDDGEPGDGDGDGDGELGEDAEAVFPTSATTMDSVQLKHLVEALIFASDKPLTVPRLRQLTRCGDTRRLELALTELAEDYRERGVVLQQVSGGYQFRTRTQFSAWVQQLIAGRPVRLSRAQLETLAIIAYRQPITRPEIDDIRGVDSTATLKLLLDRMLIRGLGKREEVGRPTLYGTTREFLDFFSLGDLRELPTLREYSELTAESRKVMSDRLGISADDEGGHGGRGGGGTSGGDNGSGGGDVGGGGDAGGGPLPDLDTGAPADDGGGAAEASADDLAGAFFAAADAVDRADAAAEALPEALSDDGETIAVEAFGDDDALADEPAVEAVAAIEPAEATEAVAAAVEAVEAIEHTVAVETFEAIEAAASVAPVEAPPEASESLQAAPEAPESSDVDGRVERHEWPAGSEPVAVVASIDLHPVEPPAVHASVIDVSSLDAAEQSAAQHPDPAADPSAE